ncbi:hypothetical protein A3K79_00900 [Candidatus Bathyarchaeota archaeon RBG_13_46_16b]|nr:MAG: hypothetical protein A3K79_00900 [Candidatus Bathyarchaeota archaeon RBG_13_46_16b]
MRFLDANVFVYAYCKPKEQLTQKERQMKEQAKRIISIVSQGREQVTTTVVHLSEIVNILKHGMPLDQLTIISQGLFMLDNVKIIGITGEAYFAATEFGVQAIESNGNIEKSKQAEKRDHKQSR